jgi:hypothetical protein
MLKLLRGGRHARLRPARQSSSHHWTTIYEYQQGARNESAKDGSASPINLTAPPLAGRGELDDYVGPCCFCLPGGPISSPAWIYPSRVGEWRQDSYSISAKQEEPVLCASASWRDNSSCYGLAEPGHINRPPLCGSRNVKKTRQSRFCHYSRIRWITKTIRATSKVKA